MAKRTEPVNALVHEPSPPNLPAQVSDSNPIGAMMREFMERGATADAAAAIDKMMEAYLKMEAVGAEKSFARAFAAFQDECPNVAVSKAVPLKGGGVKFRYAPFESIIDEVGPTLRKHGFSFTHSTDYRSEPVRVVATCTLIHTDGHRRSADFSCRVGAGAPGLSAAQEDGAAATTAMRRAFCAVCGIVVRSTDAREEGEPITPAEAAAIEERVGRACGGDVEQIARYLKLGGANNWADIRRAKYEVVVAALDAAESPPNRNLHNPEQKSETTAPAVPFPASYDDAGAWRSAMLEQMAARWGCPAKAAAGAFDAILKASGVTSYVAVEIPRRKAAWESLTTGKLDRYAPKPGGA